MHYHNSAQGTFSGLMYECVKHWGWKTGTTDTEELPQEEWGQDFLPKMPNMFLPSTAPSFQPDSLDNPPLLVSHSAISAAHVTLSLAKVRATLCKTFCKGFLSKIIFYFIFLIFQPHYLWGWGLFLSWDYYRLSHILWQSEVLLYGLFFFPVMDFNHSLELSKLPSRYTN